MALNVLDIRRHYKYLEKVSRNNMTLHVFRDDDPVAPLHWNRRWHSKYLEIAGHEAILQILRIGITLHVFRNGMTLHVFRDDDPVAPLHWNRMWHSK